METIHRGLKYFWCYLARPPFFRIDWEKSSLWNGWNVPSLESLTSSFSASDTGYEIMRS